eukprot:356893-Chlamydomonas_euryale.AAC.1
MAAAVGFVLLQVWGSKRRALCGGGGDGGDGGVCAAAGVGQQGACALRTEASTSVASAPRVATFVLRMCSPRRSKAEEPSIPSCCRLLLLPPATPPPFAPTSYTPSPSGLPLHSP